MNAKLIEFDHAALDRIACGVNLLADAVACTLGPRGRNVVLERVGGTPLITKDGASVARGIALLDPIDDIGAQALMEAAAHTAECTGDGTTTSVVLARAIFREGLKTIAVGINPMELKRGIDIATAAAIEAINIAAKPCASDKSILRICEVSTNGDCALAATLADAVSKMGKDGVVIVEQGSSLADELLITEGVRFNQGYLTTYFVTELARQVAVLENPLVLLHAEEITGAQELWPLLAKVAQADRSLLIIAKGISDAALATLSTNSARGLLRVVAVKAPGQGDLLRAQLDDIAVVSGATVISEDTGTELAAVTLTQLGNVTRVEVDANSTTLVGHSADPAALASRLRYRHAQLKLTRNRTEHKQLETWLANLSGRVAVLRLGASSGPELAYRMACAEDALAAARAAIEEGVVPGGGVALLRAGQAIEHVCSDNDGEAAGIRVVRRALEEPLRQIAANCGAHPPVVVNAVQRQTGDVGYDAVSGEYTDLSVRGIMDPAKVTKTALRNAASVAGMLLTTSCAITRIASRAASLPVTYTPREN